MIELPDWAEPLCTPSRYKAFYGGRGSAKSHTMATALVLRAYDVPTRILCAREIQKSIRDSVKRLLDDKIAAAGLGNFFKSTDNEISGANGSLFTFAGLRSNIESIKSMEGIDIAWVSEARAVSQTSLDVLKPTIRKDNSEIWFDWNPGLPTDPIDVMFRGPAGPPPRSIVRRVNYSENPWFPDVLREEMEWDLRRDPDKHAFIWKGEYQRNSEARVFKNWTVEAFDTPANASFYFGADWGFSVDPTTLVRMYIVDRTIFIDHEAYAVGCEIDDTPALFDTVPGARQWLITADSARPETISYMRRQNFRMQAAKKGAGSVEEGIQFLKSYDIVVHPRCQHVIDELTLYSFKIDPLTGGVTPVLDDKNNHMIDAARYGLEGVRRNTFGLLEYYAQQVAAKEASTHG